MMPSDPFQDAHRANDRKAIKDDAARQIMERDQRIVAAEKKRKEPKRVDPPYPWPKKIWEP